MRHTQPLETDVAAPSPYPADVGFSTTMCQHIKLLDESLRIVVELRFLRDLDNAEIAGHLGIQPAAVGDMLNSALEQLRKSVSE